jgi:hypothetical protein
MTRLIVPVTPRDRFLSNFALPGVASDTRWKPLGASVHHSEIGVGSTFTIVLPLADG